MKTYTHNDTDPPTPWPLEAPEPNDTALLPAEVDAPDLSQTALDEDTADAPLPTVTLPLLPPLILPSALITPTGPLDCWTTH